MKMYVIFNISELNKIDFNEIEETDIETIRKSVDGSKTFVKWEGETPKCVLTLETKEGIYTYDEIMTILNTDEWSAKLQLN